jgi:hypothetical protein
MYLKKLLVLAVLMGVSSPALAYKWELSPESSLNLAVLMQPQYQTIEDGAPSGKDWSNDLFLRRVRIMIYGQVTKNLSFFLDTDQVNYGKNGDFAATFFVQDAFLAYKAMDEFQVAMGLILLPFTRHNFQGATSLHGLDYHTSLIKFPGDTQKVWRDMGVQVYGWALGQKLHYRAGVFGGYQNAKLVQADPVKGNPEVKSTADDRPRFTGHLRYNILGKETDFFAKGIYFSPEPIVSVGVGADFVPNAMVAAPAFTAGAVSTKAKIADHLGLAGDAFVEFPLDADNEILFQGTFFKYDDGAKMAGTGTGFLTELGYRWKFLEPIVGYDSFNSEGATGDYQAIRGGLNFWAMKHGFNLKGEVTLFKVDDLDKAYLKMFTLQSQLLF